MGFSPRNRSQASTIHERLKPDLVLATDESQDHLVAARMQAWVKAAAHSDWAAFAKRLEWTAWIRWPRRVLGSVCLQPRGCIASMDSDALRRVATGASRASENVASTSNTRFRSKTSLLRL